MSNHFDPQGYHPYLIITKGDSIDPEFTKDKWKVWDYEILQEKRLNFIQATGSQQSQTFFNINYVPGSFNRDDIIDYTSLRLANETEGVVNRLAACLLKKQISPNSNRADFRC